ncbi:cyclic nucleotide-binding domain-containing protein [Microbulbifer harenosus]|uniref:Cyclic nucleotide-binding domain-containing protein n=1 Tax=Microbulbifer harenosus TaxID=2576840 RepID=A0ABY2UGG1_9GAMM|nr:MULTISPECIES: cyclic nucleotide-binding domain-containing protein [Microbulbifer]QIL91546.1 cyclic nucleotide-binding domain-containing protein [Microbulbifer sp. SH-1]TLM76632.1 cyclic nucleotide-binding domain-containing protein [Microbulbifer harenosus]
MDYKPLSEFPRDAVDRLLNVIHLFRDIRATSEWQYDVLLKRSRLVSLAHAEALLHAGDVDQWVYFLLRGELQVHVDDTAAAQGERPLAVIRPGELFGDLSMLLAEPRSATIVAAPVGQEIQVLAVDCTLFGDLEDFSLLHLPSKLVFYRNMVHSLRWKLEVYRSKYPSHELANSHRRLKLYTGPKNCREELHALADQARDLARILLDWNAEFGSGQLAAEESDMSDFLESILS